jgi:AraC-like DNA-binding protein
MNFQAQPAGSDYREFPVPAQLASHFFCFWTQVIVGSGKHAHRVLPDACVDIVFINEESPIVVGPWTNPFTATFCAGTRIVGARLRPGYAPGVLGIPAAELLNRSIPLSVVWDRSKTSSFARLSCGQSLTARRLALSEILSGTFASTPPDGTVVSGIHWLAQQPHGQVKELSRWMGISERQLHRRFASAVGYGPKMFQSVLRFQRFLYLAERNKHRAALADVAASVGYADQPHMTREVGRFAGDCPTALPDSAKCTLLFSGLLRHT